MPVYDLVVAKGGPKFKQAETVDATELKQKHQGGGKVTGGGMAVQGPNGTQFYGISMAMLGQRVLSSVAGRPVVDKTGLTGHYDLSLPSSALPPQPGRRRQTTNRSHDSARGAGVATTAGEGQLEMLVIDHVERPTEN